jgi:hypothetical protein
MTPEQLAIIKADIAASADMNTLPNNSDGSFEIARLYNLPASPTFSVWRTDASVDAIMDAINFSLYTPNDAPDNTATYTNRALNIQTKQINLQLMTQGRTTLNCAKVNIRGGLRDAVIQVPSGASGAMTAPGGASGATVLNNCTRPATRLEKLLAAASQGSDTTGTVAARVMGFEGYVSYQDIDIARA